MVQYYVCVRLPTAFAGVAKVTRAMRGPAGVVPLGFNTPFQTREAIVQTLMLPTSHRFHVKLHGNEIEEDEDLPNKEFEEDEEGEATADEASAISGQEVSFVAGLLDDDIKAFRFKDWYAYILWKHVDRAAIMRDRGNKARRMRRRTTIKRWFNEMDADLDGSVEMAELW